jgi:hypothetical protein
MCSSVPSFIFGVVATAILLGGSGCGRSDQQPDGGKPSRKLSERERKVQAAVRNVESRVNQKIIEMERSFNSVSGQARDIKDDVLAQGENARVSLEDAADRMSDIAQAVKDKTGEVIDQISDLREGSAEVAPTPGRR